MLPQFPEFKDVDLSFQEIFNGFLSRHPLEASEYNFTNIFAFRKAYSFKVSLLYDNLIIFRNSEPVSVFCPVGNSRIPEVFEPLFSYLKTRTNDPYLERVPESFVNKYLMNNQHLIIQEERDHFDYVYHVKELAQLRGKTR